MNRLLNMVCVFQLSWRKGKLTTCPLLRRHIELLVKVVVLRPQEKGKKVAHSPVKVARQFEVSSPSPPSSRKRTVIDDPNFAAVLTTESPRGKTRKSGRDRKAAPIFQGGMP